MFLLVACMPIFHLDLPPLRWLSEKLNELLAGMELVNAKQKNARTHTAQKRNGRLWMCIGLDDCHPLNGRFEAVNWCIVAKNKRINTVLHPTKRNEMKKHTHDFSM